MTTMVVPAQTNRPRLPSVRTETACCHREQQSQRLGPEEIWRGGRALMDQGAARDACGPNRAGCR
jgi:hypothetical protein